LSKHSVRHVIDLLLLAALWGASFLFLRVAAPEFGPVALIEIRVLVASLFLLPVLYFREGFAEGMQHWHTLPLMGVINSALPFVLLAYATLYLTSGFTSVVNATTPLWAAVIAWLWLGDRLNRSRVMGLGLGFVGVVILVSGDLHWPWGGAQQSDFQEGAALAIPAGFLATLCYGLGASYSSRSLSAVSPLTLASGSQLGAALCLLPAALWWWPTAAISWQAWGAAITLGVACTGIAYILYFRLIQHIGPARTISVTFLIPAFAILWGGWLLDEVITWQMLLGGAVILSGTALATGIVPLWQRKHSQQHSESLS